MGHLFILWWGLGTVLLIVVLAAVYVSVSADLRAGLENAVVSIPCVADDPHAFLRAFAGAAGQIPQRGNAVTLYQNGDEILPAMLDAIARARSSVHFATFIYWAGATPDAFAAAFCAAAARGVAVRVVLDSSGASKIHGELIARMRAAGCDVRWFRRFRWYNWQTYDHRSHRRLLVIDGVEGFTGGVGIADVWNGNGDAPDHWRDTHVRVRGPAVGSLQIAFVDSWNTCSRELPLDASFFPVIPDAGDATVCIIQSTPTAGTSPAQRAMAALIAGAKHSLHITNAYFIPSEPFRRALVAAGRRGVQVQILIPGPLIDEGIVRRASRTTWAELLAGGVELYEFEPAMVHAKTMVVDGVVTLVGSINFDPRSFALNAECGAVAYDPSVGAEAERAFAADLAKARRLTLADVARRGPVDRSLDRLSYWVRAQL